MFQNLWGQKHGGCNPLKTGQKQNRDDEVGNSYNRGAVREQLSKGKSDRQIKIQ